MIWSHLFGRGIIDPVDDFGEANPPSHPELLTMLGREIAALEFDVKPFLRELALTQVYQSAIDLPDEVSLSQAAAAIRPWPSPPPNAATATPKPTAITSVVVLIGDFAGALLSCANAAGAINITASSTMHTTAAFFMYCLLLNCRQEVVPGHRAAGLTLKRLQNS